MTCKFPFVGREHSAVHTDNVGVTFILIATELRLINTHRNSTTLLFCRICICETAALIVMNEPFDYESSPGERNIEKLFDYTFSHTTVKCFAIVANIDLS